MGKLDSLLKEGTKIIHSISNAFDNNFTTQEEKLKAKNEILTVVTGFLSLIMSAQKELIALEAKGNKLQRCWRPILMLCFGFIVIYSFFIQPAFFPNAVPIANSLPEHFWNLLEIGLGGYVIGRSGEKIAHSISQINFNGNKRN